MYISVNDTITLLGDAIASQLTDDADGSFVNTDLLTNLLTKQSELMDNYLRGRYTLPLTNAHYILETICFSLIKYELYKRRNIVNDAIKEEYRNAIKMLNDIKSGAILLDEPASNTFVATILNSTYTDEL